MSKETALAKAPDASSLQALAETVEVDPGFTRIMLPRLVFKAQDKFEGKGKNAKLVVAGGTFIAEHETDEINPDTGYKTWDSKEIGKTAKGDDYPSIKGVIIFERKQLSYYDETTEEYTSSPIYDKVDEVVPLFCAKKEVHRGTAEELRKFYEYKDKDGKTKTNLKDNRILYVMLDGMDGELMQLNLHGSSMFSFIGYKRNTLAPSVVTEMSSEFMEKGSIEWNKMTFKAERTLDQGEVDQVLAKIGEIKQSIVDEKAFFANQDTSTSGEKEESDDDDFLTT